MSVNILISNAKSNCRIVPWYENNLFNHLDDLLDNNILIVSRDTAKKLPILKNTIIYCVSKRLNFYGTTIQCVNNKILYFRNLLSAISFASVNYDKSKKVYIGGGNSLYRYAMLENKININNIYVITSDNVIDFNSSFVNLNSYVCSEITNIHDSNIQIYNIIRRNTEEKMYLNLLFKVLNKGEYKNGRNGITKSIFNPSNLVFTDIQNRFPLITTKKMFIRGIIEELLFFIRGETNSLKLEEKGVNIWKGNTSREFLDSIGKTHYKEGEMGPMYGYQWRNFNGSGLDQLKDVIERIKLDPNSRRLLMTTYNPLQAEEGVLYPCHSIVMQFYIREDDNLDMFVYNRSSDLFLGLPFNISMSSLLLLIIAKATNKIAGNLTIGLGDSHIYESHYDNVKKQLSRIPFAFPIMEIEREMNTIEDIGLLEYKDFILHNYKSHMSLKSEMVV